jgi:hypothetical protein
VLFHARHVEVLQVVERGGQCDGQAVLDTESGSEFLGQQDVVCFVGGFAAAVAR